VGGTHHTQTFRRSFLDLQTHPYVPSYCCDFEHAAKDVPVQINGSRQRGHSQDGGLFWKSAKRRTGHFSERLPILIEKRWTSCEKRRRKEQGYWSNDPCKGSERTKKSYVLGIVFLRYRWKPEETGEQHIDAALMNFCSHECLVRPIRHRIVLSYHLSLLSCEAIPGEFFMFKAVKSSQTSDPRNAYPNSQTRPHRHTIPFA
jgi:hypothetical protein